MAINYLSLRRATLQDGPSPSGQKEYLVGSTVKISDNIDDILDASYDGKEIPSYNDSWNDSDRTNLLRSDINAFAHDEKDGYQEGYWWIVVADYSVPEDVQNELDPTDRDWEWSKTNDKRQINSPLSLFDTSDYVYPGSSALDMVNLNEGDAVVNTIGEPPESGVGRVVSRTVINLTKYVNNITDLGVSSYFELDSFVDKVNQSAITILGVTYDEYELLLDAADYQSITENGFECIKVDFRIIADFVLTHIFTFQNASYNYLNQDENNRRQKIRDEEGTEVNTPQLIDKDGQEIPLPETAPFTKVPTLISVGRNKLADFNTISFPSTVP